MKDRIIFETQGERTITPVYFDLNLIQDPFFLTFCQELAHPLALITDSDVNEYYGRLLFKLIKKRGCDVTSHLFAAGEKSKNRSVKARLEDSLFRAGHRRDSCLIALGGGVTTDLVGYIAATFCRGVPYLSIPTSLLAMVDASMGGKTGVNLRFGKNLIGVNYPPLAIFIDFSTLRTLSDDQMREGLAEIIKHSLITHAELFHHLHSNLEKWRKKEIPFIKHIVYTSCQLKKNIVIADMRETGRRRILNFGHTIGHAIEVAEGYHISHGEAIAIGMIVEGLISYKLNKITAFAFDKIYHIFRLFGYRLALSNTITTQRMLDAMRYDKKSKQCVPQFVILNDVGAVEPFQGMYSTQIEVPLLREVLNWMIAEFSKDSI